MTTFAELLERLSIIELPITEGSVPFGTAWLPEAKRGIDLAAHGYVEQELRLDGEAAPWRWDETLAGAAGPPEPFTTRVLVRRPADPTRFSGAVALEPLHPDYDSALSWGMIGPWVVAQGHAHVGVTQEPGVLDGLREFDPERYGALRLPDGAMRFDIVGLAAAALADGRLPGLGTVTRVVLSGWSNTGTFCRTFLGEGFHARCRTRQAPAVSGYMICISSGGATSPGYASLRPGAELSLDDPRRTIGAHGVPVIELLSEGESETHGPVLRSDADGPDDRYRLYQVAGTGHIATAVPSLLTNRVQAAGRGIAVAPREINEIPSDARMDMVARGVFAMLDRWITDGVAPPRAPRFRFADPTSTAPRGIRAEAVPLVRDADGNVLDGVRTPWVTLPRAGYLPHSTPRPGRCEPGPGAPYTDPRIMADLIAHRVPLEVDELRSRYGSADAYLARFADVVRDAARDGWLCESDVPELLAMTRESCGDW